VGSICGASTRSAGFDAPMISSLPPAFVIDL
jgi:hypothetical protein